MLSKKEKAELQELCKKWHNHCEYTDDHDYGTGVETGYGGAAYDLEDWLSRG